MISLASKAKAYFGAVVLTTLLLVAAGVYSAFQMPSGVYPEVTFPRIAVVAKAPGLDLTTQELKVTRPLEEVVATVDRRLRGPLQDHARLDRAVHHLLAGHRHEPGAGIGVEPHRRRALRPACRRELHRRADDAVRLPHHVRSS